MLTQELKDKWVTALRSGEYAQGKHTLRRNNNTFCCLGVLCDIIDNTKWSKIPNLSRDWIYVNSDHNINSMILSNVIQHALMGMNDIHNQSFDEIADWIEGNIKVAE